MAEKIPLYLDFAAGEVVSFSATDTIPSDNIPGGGTFQELSDGPGVFETQAGKFIKVNAGETALEYATLVGGGDLLAANNLSDVASAATSRTNLGISTTANQSDSANKRFVTDAQLVVIGNTSGTNTGDQTLPVKATGAEVDTGTDDAKFLTPKAIEDSSYIKAAYADAKVADAINDGTTTIAPSQNAVFDALALKQRVIVQTEIDFGTAPLAEQTFSISDANATVGSKITASLAYDAPTGKDLDELEMDDLIIKCGNATTGFFDMLIKSVDGSYLADKFKINYLIN